MNVIIILHVEVFMQINTPITFCSNHDTKVKKQAAKQYKDPLNSPLITAASYSNEVGAAISEVAPRLGTALWIPALMYLGADIYDKYKNDVTEFNPSARRAFERTLYQGIFGFVCMPLLIFMAQNAVSPLGKLTKDGISTNAKDAVFKHTKELITQCEGDKFNDKDKFKQALELSLKNKIQVHKQEKASLNIFKRIYHYSTPKAALTNSNQDKILAFAAKNADKMYEIKEALLSNDNSKVPPIVRKTYEKSGNHMSEIFGNNNYALKKALKEYQNMNIFQNKILKTIGGFMPIIFLGKPLGKFIEKIVVDKYIDLGLDKISKGFVQNTRLKHLFNEMDKENTEHAKAKTQEIAEVKQEPLSE